IVESLWMQASPYVRAAAQLYDRARDTAATQHHDEILQAIRLRDQAAMVSALAADIQRAFRILEHAAPEFWARREEAA
ncbi:MAG: hypothetical protein ACOH2M_24400, partial [Cypionkella sp.]